MAEGEQSATEIIVQRFCEKKMAQEVWLLLTKRIAWVGRRKLRVDNSLMVLVSSVFLPLNPRNSFVEAPDTSSGHVAYCSQATQQVEALHLLLSAGMPRRVDKIGTFFRAILWLCCVFCWLGVTVVG